MIPYRIRKDQRFTQKRKEIQVRRNTGEPRKITDLVLSKFKQNKDSYYVAKKHYKRFTKSHKEEHLTLRVISHSKFELLQQTITNSICWIFVSQQDTTNIVHSSNKHEDDRFMILTHIWMISKIFLLYLGFLFICSYNCYCGSVFNMNGLSFIILGTKRHPLIPINQ